MAFVAFDPGRRNLIRGRVRADASVLRPPWAVGPVDFPELCERCDGCVHACPQGLLTRGDGGYPQLSFHDDGCDFCGLCLSACQGRALRSATPDPDTAFGHVMTVNASCLAAQGVGCRICGDFCDQGAIRFPPIVGGQPQPRLDAQRCNGCGRCVAPCPTGAIQIQYVPTEVRHG